MGICYPVSMFIWGGEVVDFSVACFSSVGPRYQVVDVFFFWAKVGICDEDVAVAVFN